MKVDVGVLQAVPLMLLLFCVVMLGALLYSAQTNAAQAITVILPLLEENQKLRVACQDVCVKDEWEWQNGTWEYVENFGKGEKR